MASSTSPMKIPKIETYEHAESQIDIKPKRKLPDDVYKWPWEVQTEILTSLLHRKPVGLDAHFRMMALINDVVSPPSKTTDSNSEVSFQLEKTHSTVLEYEITSKDIWKYVNTFYDVAALNDTETPHPMSAKGIKEANADAGVEMGDDIFFELSLPEAEYGSMIRAKLEQSAKAAAANATPDSPPPAKRRKGKGTTSSGRQSVAALEETESVSSSRSSTPASGGIAAPTPTTRRSRQQR